MVAASAPAVAIPRLDLSGYPAPKQGLKRWVIQPSGLLPKSADAMISSHPLDWRVQLIAYSSQRFPLRLNRIRNTYRFLTALLYALSFIRLTVLTCSFWTALSQFLNEGGLTNASIRF